MADKGKQKDRAHKEPLRKLRKDTGKSPTVVDTASGCEESENENQNNKGGEESQVHSMTVMSRSRSVWSTSRSRSRSVSPKTPAKKKKKSKKSKRKGGSPLPGPSSRLLPGEIPGGADNSNADLSQLDSSQELSTLQEEDGLETDDN